MEILRGKAIPNRRVGMNEPGGGALDHANIRWTPGLWDEEVGGGEGSARTIAGYLRKW